MDQRELERLGWNPRYRELRADLVAHVDPELQRVLADGGHDALTSVVTTLHPGVHTVRLLTLQACSMLHDEVAALDAWTMEHGVRLIPPNTMNRYGVILDQVGYQAALHQLMVVAVNPLATILFPECGGDSLDHHHGFVVDYGLGKDIDLALHADNSEVTVNLCLGDSFVGGDLRLLGRRCARHMQEQALPDEAFDYAHVPGIALLHAGMHRHAAHAIESGERRNLILWTRSSQFRSVLRTECPTWCGTRTAASTIG